MLAVSVFLPWYGVSVTASGAAVAQQQLAAVAQQYGNATLQADANTIASEFGALQGRQLATVSARQALKNVSLILLVLAGIALLASLLRLADLRGMLYATGGQIALLGVLAAGVVIFRVLFRPGPGQGLISLSLSWGIWVALLSSAAVFVGGLMSGSAQTRKRTSPKVGPGPPPLGGYVR